MPAPPPVIDRTCKWANKCRAITGKGCQCSNSPYAGESKENHKPRFCFKHRNPQSRKYGEVIDPAQAVTGMNSQVYQPSNGEDTNLYPPPLQVPTTTKAALHLPHESSQFQQFAVGFAFNPMEPHQSNPDQGFAFNPMEHQSNPDQGPPSPRTSSDTNMHTSHVDAESSHTRRQSKGKGPAINESQALQSLITQLDRIELRGASKEDVQRLEMSCASKANVESLEIRVQHLERAVHRLPGSDQMPGHDEVVMKMNSTLSEHLAAIQGQYDFVCAQRDEAGRRADGLHRRSESARRTYVSTLQKYHENNREQKLRGEQAQYLWGLKQRIEARMEGIPAKSEAASPSHMVMEEEL